MKIILILFVFISVATISFSQFRNLKVVSENFYLRYYYKIEMSDETINDSVYYTCKRIDFNSFILNKFVNTERVWTKKYKIEAAKRSVVNYDRSRDKFGNLKTKKSKIEYFNANPF